jgi:hypothetical protein
MFIVNRDFGRPWDSLVLDILHVDLIKSTRLFKDFGF